MLLMVAAGLAVVVAYYIATSADAPRDPVQAATAPVARADAQSAAPVSAVSRVEPAPNAASSAPPATTAPAEPPAVASVSPPIAATPALRANGEVDRPAGLVTLTIESEPAGATVIRKQDGVRLGTTPYAYSIEPVAGEVAFLLQLEGHRTLKLSMPADRDGIRQVVLLSGDGGEVVPAAPARELDQAQVGTALANDARSLAKGSKSTTDQTKRSDKERASTKPAKRSKPEKTSKSSGTVDYTADPLPL